MDQVNIFISFLCVFVFFVAILLHSAFRTQNDPLGNRGDAMRRPSAQT